MKEIILEKPVAGEVWPVEAKATGVSAIWDIYANSRLAAATARRFKKKHEDVTFSVSHWLATGPQQREREHKEVFVVTNNAPPNAEVRCIATSLEEARQLKQTSWQVVQKDHGASLQYCLRIECWDVEGAPEQVDRSKWP